jgi:hypothetical protein
VTAPNTPPAGNDAGKAFSPGRSAQVRVVRDPADNALVTALFCCQPFGHGRWCLRVKGHAGGCIAWGPRPLKHIHDDNGYRRTA